MTRYTPGIRTKLISIFILIKVLPLIALAWFAWNEIAKLTDAVEKKSARMVANTHDVVTGVTELSTENSIRALDIKSREAIERLTTDTAMQVADFLYDRDRDIALVSKLPTNEIQYRQFLNSHHKPVILHAPWKMDEQGERWMPVNTSAVSDGLVISATNDDNRRDFHYRQTEQNGIIDNRPLYLELTFVDLAGNELIKVGTSQHLSPMLKNIADPENTYCRAETYFAALKQLKPGEIHVSEVIGPYVKSDMVGTYSRKGAEQRGITFRPEQSGYAGKENPVGIRFQGLIRWATPVVKDGHISGYVTLALDHSHVMEFTDHIVPTDERYSAISDAGSGNYAFMWDNKGRNISHPRDYFIVGYDPETGQQAVPWLDEEMHAIWEQNNRSMVDFQLHAPEFKEQTLTKKPAPSLTRAGMLGLDCRYLNFAPQCVGWHNLTQEGGSGSFLIFWSGLWKLTTAAAIPYRTGAYGNTPRGFGFVTIGANVEDFHRSAVETAKNIHAIEAAFTEKLESEKATDQALMHSTMQKALSNLTLYTALMVVFVIIIAIFMANLLTTRITTIMQGIRRFQQGDRDYRLKQLSSDEVGQLTKAYNEMADDVHIYISNMEESRSELEIVNTHLEEEITERKRVQDELSMHRDNLEALVQNRTTELKKEIAERIRVETVQKQGEARLLEQNSALRCLASHEALYTGDLDTSLQVIVPLAAATLKADHFSVWLLDEQGVNLIRRQTITANGDTALTADTMKPADLPSYMSALEKDRTIASDHARHDKRLAEVIDKHLLPQHVHSLLSAAIFEDGEMAGVVSFLQSHFSRQWHLDEINFANSIADVVGLAIGVAKRNKAIEEKEQLAARLRRAEKMEAIGTLAGGVAHDLNNILSGIVSYPELLLLQLPMDSKLREPIKTIISSGNRAATIVQDLLTLARRGVAIVEVVNMNRIVEDYLHSPEHAKMLSYHTHIKIITRLEPGLMNISGSPVHLSKALMNLVSNAAEALQTAGSVTIRTENCYIDRPVKGYDIVIEGDYIALTVEDTGMGILPADLNRIFEPFYTKKKMGQSGTGLGMSVVWGTVKDHHGYIDFDSFEGKGSRFTLYFPVTRKLIEEVTHVAIDAYQGNGETILVVDDVHEQREIASAILTTLGYHCSTVESGEGAIDYLKENTIDLLVLDMIMDPGIDGLDTYKQILKRHPNQKAIVASGFSETERIREVLRLGASSYLKKPYSIEKIGAAVHLALKSR